MFEDHRTDEEKRNDKEYADKARAEQRLSLGLLKSVGTLLKNAGANAGLAGNDHFNKALLLVEVDGVTYKLTAEVDHCD